MYLLRITDSTTTVTLTGDAPILGVTYFPSAGAAAEKTVTETAMLILEGTETAIRAKLNVLSRLLDDATNRKDLLSSRVYIEKQETSTSTLMRSEVQSGEIPWSQTPGRHRLDATLNTVEVAIIFTRLNF